MKKITCLILLISTMLLAEEDMDSNKRILLSGMIVSSWAAAGITEGLKFRQVENSSFIWKEDYHVYRAITGINLVTSPILALNMNKSSVNIKTALVSNIIGWALYEGMISYVMYEDFWRDRGNFYILNNKIPRPPPALALTLSALLSVEICYRF